MMLNVVFCAVLAWACWLGMVRGQDVAFTQEPSVREALNTPQPHPHAIPARENHLNNFIAFSAVKTFFLSRTGNSNKLSLLILPSSLGI